MKCQQIMDLLLNSSTYSRFLQNNVDFYFNTKTNFYIILNTQFKTKKYAQN